MRKIIKDALKIPIEKQDFLQMIWYNNNAIPTIPSLVKICDAFQITLSEFFAKAEGSESVPVALTPQQMQIIEKWSILRPDQQEAVLNLLNTIP